MPTAMVNVRYIVDDVEAALAWYTQHLGFTVLSNAAPAFADVTLGSLRLLLSGPKSSAGRAMPDGERPGPGGWNRIHLIVDDLPAEVERLRAAGVRFRNDIVTGPGGSQILLQIRRATLLSSFNRPPDSAWSRPIAFGRLRSVEEFAEARRLCRRGW